MLEPLKQWYCDVCGNVIERPEDGYVVWKSDENHQYYEFKIIHAGKCDDRSSPCSMHLSAFIGLDGSNYLLSWLSIGPIKENLGQRRFVAAKDMSEYVDFFRRVQTPYYEEARRKFRSRNLLDDRYDDNELGPYFVDDLKGIVENY